MRLWYYRKAFEWFGWERAPLRWCPYRSGHEWHFVRRLPDGEPYVRFIDKTMTEQDWLDNEWSWRWIFKRKTALDHVEEFREKGGVK